MSLHAMHLVRHSSSLAAGAARRASAAATASVCSASAAATPAVASAQAAVASLQSALSAALRARVQQAHAATVSASSASAVAAAASATAAAPAPAIAARISTREQQRAQHIATRFAARRRARALAAAAAADEPPSSSSSSSAAAPPPSPPATAAGTSTEGVIGGPRLHPGIHTRDLKPSELVRELDRFIIGQGDAKKAVAIALRNRWRRHRLSEDLRKEVTPKNILMIGPTGCGKTEIARRLAKLTESPFLKVEATKFTETGFHGKDVDSIVSDLLRVAITNLKQRHRAEAKKNIQRAVQDKILEALTAGGSTAESFRAALEAGALEGIEIEIEVPMKDPSAELGGAEGEKTGANSRRDEQAYFKSFAERLTRQLSGKSSELRKLSIAEARPLLEEAQLDLLHRPEDLIKDALVAVANDGIVFIDEIDKICTGGKDTARSADASAEGVQRDLLPLLEGTTVTTKQGDIQTDHILFIASGAFHAVKPSDLMAELQGRLPIRVELKALTEDELYQVLTRTENNLCQQQVELLAVDKVNLEWKDEAVREIAKVACEVNRSVENIGARRLNTVIERIVDDLSYHASDVAPGTKYVVDAAFVRTKVGELLKTTDLGKFML